MNQADTYAEIVAARSSYVSQQEYKSQIKMAYLEGMKTGLSVAASKIEGMGARNRLWGYNQEQVPGVLAAVIRDITVDLGGEDVE